MLQVSFLQLQHHLIQWTTCRTTTSTLPGVSSDEMVGGPDVYADNFYVQVRNILCNFDC